MGLLRVHWIILFSLALCFLGHTSQQATRFAESQCLSVEVSKGEIGEGKLTYCYNGSEQEIYLSGELDLRPTDRNEKNAADLVALKKIMAQFQKKRRGIFRIVTNNAGGGETEWHQNLMMAVEDACIKDCRIITEIKGRCESACNQLHITCVSNARTILHNAARTCDHATTDEDSPKCHKRDPLVPGERDLCGVRVAVNEYKERCGELTKGRNLNLDGERKKQIYEFIESLARKGVFDTTKLTCTPLPWAETDSMAVY
jgi:hypothetical protein